MHFLYRKAGCFKLVWKQELPHDTFKKKKNLSEATQAVIQYSHLHSQKREGEE